MTVKDIRNITAVALSIKRKYMDKLISGEKTVEIRKSSPVRLFGEIAQGRAVVAYLIPSGSKCVEAVAAFGRFDLFDPNADLERLAKRARLPINLAWNLHGTDIDLIAKRACLTTDTLRAYIGEAVGHAWHLLRPAERFVRPIPLSLTGIHHAPQSWQYIDRNSEFCIAMENLRNRKEPRK